MKRKILLLTCGTGEGHNSAASAIAEALATLNVEVVRRDPVSFAGNKAARAVSGAYNTIIKKTPKVFGAIYKAGEAVDKTHIQSPVYYANTLYAKKLAAYMAQERFDAVVCTHLFAMEAVTYLKKHGLLTIPSYGVLTDYTCIPFFEETDLDTYFIPHADLITELVSKGMKKSRLIATGIPVSPRFCLPANKPSVRTELGLPQERPVVLVMTGGVGCGNAGEIANNLLALNNQLFLCILTGNNTQMYDSLSVFDSQSVRPVPFTDKVCRYMKASDVLISKPGGLSGTEAITAGIPFVALITIPGCEQKNAAFFAERHMCVTAHSPKEAANQALMLLADTKRRQAMTECQRVGLPQNAAFEIAQRITNA